MPQVDNMSSVSDTLRALASTEAETRCSSLICKHLRAPSDTSFPHTSSSHNGNLLSYVNATAKYLTATQDHDVAAALEEVVERATTPPDFGGYGLAIGATALTTRQEEDVIFLCTAFLEAMESEHRQRNRPKPLKSRPAGRRGMTMTEKVFAAHETAQRGFVKPGDIIQVDIDWVLASELSWQVWISGQYRSMAAY